MPKYRITWKYVIKMTEVHEIEIEDPEEIEAFHEESPFEFISLDTMIDKTEGDLVSSINDEAFEIEEIGVLDRIAEATSEEK